MCWVVGCGLSAEDHRVQRIIDDFWQDADNRMDERIYALLTELALFGEQFVRFFVDPLTGRTVVRQLDPLYVTEIETDPEDVERPPALPVRPAARWRTGDAAGGRKRGSRRSRSKPPQ